jgi:hypothetical protein
MLMDSIAMTILERKWAMFKSRVKLAADENTSF